MPKFGLTMRHNVKQKSFKISFIYRYRIKDKVIKCNVKLRPASADGQG